MDPQFCPHHEITTSKYHQGWYCLLPRTGYAVLGCVHFHTDNPQSLVASGNRRSFRSFASFQSMVQIGGRALLHVLRDPGDYISWRCIFSAWDREWRVTSGQMTWGQVSEEWIPSACCTSHIVTRLPPKPIGLGMQCLEPGRREEPRHPGAAAPPASLTVLVYLDLSALRTSPPSWTALCSRTWRPRALVGPLPPLRPLLEVLHHGPVPERRHFCVLTLSPSATNPLTQHQWSLSGLPNALTAISPWRS